MDREVLGGASESYQLHGLVVHAVVMWVEQTISPMNQITRRRSPVGAADTCYGLFIARSRAFSAVPENSRRAIFFDCKAYKRTTSFVQNLGPKEGSGVPMRSPQESALLLDLVDECAAELCAPKVCSFQVGSVEKGIS